MIPYFFAPPIIDANAPNPRRALTLSGTGATESSNTAKLVPDKFYVLTNGATPVYVGFSIFGGQTDVVDSTNGFLIPANTVFPFKCLSNKDEGYSSEYIYVEAVDGTSDYVVSLVCAN